MMRSRAFRFFLLSTTMLLTALAMGNSGQIGLAQQATLTEPSSFVYETISKQQTLDPVWAFDTASFAVIEQLYEPLIAYKGGSTQDFVPVVASALPTVSADGLTYTFTLRTGIKFHNGDALTPEDVQYSFLRLLITDRAGGSGFLLLPELLGIGSTRDENGDLKKGRIDRICGYNGKPQAVTTDLEKNTVIFHLVQRFTPFVQILSGEASAIVDKKFVVAKGGWPGCTGDRDTDIANFQKYNNPPNQSNTELFDVENGSGPYILQKWDQAAGITTMVAYPNYWQGDPSKNGSFKTLIFKEVEEFGLRLLDLQNGNTDVIDLGTPSNLPAVYRTGGSRSVVKLPGSAVQSLFFNFEIQQPGGSNLLIGSGKLDGNGIPPDFFQDVHVRKAFNNLFDHTLYLQRAYNGLAITPATPLAQGLSFYNPEQPTVSEAGGIKDFVKDGALQKAADEFKQAFGGSLDKPGPAWTNGFAFTMRYNSGDQVSQIAGELLQSELQILNEPAQFGRHGSFNLLVQNVSFALLLNQIDNGTIPIFAQTWTPSYIDPADYLPHWMGSNEVGSAFSGPNSIDALPEWGPLLGAFLDIDLAKGESIVKAVPAQAEIVTIFTTRSDVDYEVAGSKGTVEGGKEVDVKIVAGQTVKVTAKDDTRIDLTFWMVHQTPGGIEYKSWDDLLTQGAATSDPVKRKEIYFTLQKLFVDNAIAIMLSQPESEFIERSWLSGYRYNPADPGNILPVLYNPAAGIKFSKATDGNGSDDRADICANYPQAIFVVGGATPAATDCKGNPVGQIPGTK